MITFFKYNIIYFLGVVENDIPTLLDVNGKLFPRES